MKHQKTWILALGLTSSLFLGCESKTGTGVLVGGALGAGVGGIAGGGTGALIGGAAGVIAGGLVGAALDEQDARNLHRESPRTYRRIDHGERLSVQDIINLSRADISDAKIIELIQKTRSHYNLNSYQIERLRDGGVSERVINYMMYQT